jgi:hypothetical protein
MTKTSILLGVMLFSCASQAQVARDRAEKVRDRQALRQDGREKRDDWRDAARVEGLIARFDAARARGDFAALSAIDAELRGLLAAELTESRGELQRDRAEVRQDNREVRSDRRELVRDGAAGRGPLVKADDRHDLRDDRRDRRDDLRDVRGEARQAARVAQIDSELAGLAGRSDAPSLDRKRALMGELVALARQELRQDRREAGEDHRGKTDASCARTCGSGTEKGRGRHPLSYGRATRLREQLAARPNVAGAVDDEPKAVATLAPRCVHHRPRTVRKPPPRQVGVRLREHPQPSPEAAESRAPARKSEPRPAAHPLRAACEGRRCCAEALVRTGEGLALRRGGCRNAPRSRWCRPGRAWRC